MTKIMSFALCILLHLTSQVHAAEDASMPEKTQTQQVAADASSQDVSRDKRAVDMRRLARGIQMLRLGKRASSPEEDLYLQDLLSTLGGQYYDEDYPVPAFEEDPLHARYQRSTDPSQEMLPSEEDSDFGTWQWVDDGENDQMSADKRPMSMLRLGKRPMSMLRLGKRPVNMLRLGKRPMSMLRLGKRPVSMLRLGKRPMSMLRLGKRPMSMLRLGKRPVHMLRLGKREAVSDSL
ncbi:uncharacterized protein LOC143286733 [Babylonia areolata]|uniref:uncharacterized protein LOC143286733 n=1 Tax=Babylonia areolata TaxID=304850 RepID=UPI003FD09611